MGVGRCLQVGLSGGADLRRHRREAAIGLLFSHIEASDDAAILLVLPGHFDPASRLSLKGRRSPQRPCGGGLFWERLTRR